MNAVPMEEGSRRRAGGDGRTAGAPGARAERPLRMAADPRPGDGPHRSEHSPRSAPPPYAQWRGTARRLSPPAPPPVRKYSPMALTSFSMRSSVAFPAATRWGKKKEKQ